MRPRRFDRLSAPLQLPQPDRAVDPATPIERPFRSHFSLASFFTHFPTGKTSRRWICHHAAAATAMHSRTTPTIPLTTTLCPTEPGRFATVQSCQQWHRNQVNLTLAFLLDQHSLICFASDSVLVVFFRVCACGLFL